MTGAEVQKAFLDIRDEFKGINIPKPMDFIRWKRPGLRKPEQDMILKALCGRATKKAAKYLPAVREVLNELKSAA